jgi:hypothetical protein
MSLDSSQHITGSDEINRAPESPMAYILPAFALIAIKTPGYFVREFSDGSLQIE